MNELNIEDLTYAWEGVIAYYNTETPDGRIIQLPEGEQRGDLPAPLRVPLQVPHGSVAFEIVGLVTDIRIEGNRLIASGRCDREISGVAVADFDNATTEWRERHTGKWFPEKHLLVVKNRLDYNLIRVSNPRLRAVTVTDGSSWGTHEPIAVKIDQ